MARRKALLNEFSKEATLLVVGLPPSCGFSVFAIVAEKIRLPSSLVTHPVNTAFPFKPTRACGNAFFTTPISAINSAAWNTLNEFISDMLSQTKIIEQWIIARNMPE